MQVAVEMPRPFVKWAGGKRFLLPSLVPLVPRRMGAYHEPFLGGGALLFALLSSRPGLRCSGSDANADLVCAYEAVRDSADELVSALRAHEARYLAGPRDYYYAVRDSAPRGTVQRAARLLFLNRTCYNGLYRVNSRGRFNVPHGRYERPNIVNEKKVRAAGAALRASGADISRAGFEGVLGRAKRGDFVYFDPPYLPASSTSFTAYTDGKFGYADLRRLAGVCSELDGAGVRVMVSNTDASAVEGLFSGWTVRRVPSRRMVNSVASGRTGHADMLLTNY